MSADENMPDIDNMSPEDLMAWMESLAKRQGADERGFTTSADMEVAEIDPNSVDTSSMGEYIPHGWTEERWQQQLAKEAAEREARASQQQQARPEPAPVEPEPVASAPPEPEPVAEAATAPAASADETDFDNMSPEQLMAWMESLAKRQGGDERGFLTSADMEVAEVDPDSVDLSDQPEYIPHGWTPERWAEQQRKETEEREARKAAQKAAPPPPAVPEPEPEPERIDALPEAEEEPEPVLDLPVLDEFDEFDEDEETAQFTPLVEEDSMSWLEDLAGDEESAMPDLSGLEEEAVDPLAALSDLGSDGGDPMEWLGTLSQGDDLDLGDLGDLAALGIEDDDEEALPDLSSLLPSDRAEPVASGEALGGSPIDTGEDPLNWLESLAKRQGADEEELATAADMDIPMPESVDSEGPGYTPYSFEEPEAELPDFLETDEEEDYDDDEALDLTDLDDPEAWLDRLAMGASGSSSDDDIFAEDEEEDDDLSFITEDAAESSDVIAEVDEGEVIESLKQGTVTPEQMASFFEKQFEKAEQIGDDYDDEDDFDPDAPAVPAEIPDWLMEQMQTQQTGETEAVSEAESEAEPPVLSDEIVEPPPVEEMPEWLSDDVEEPAVEGDISDIFDESVDVTSEQLEIVDTAEMLAEADDSWVEAFIEEHKWSETGEEPEWYRQAISELGEAEDASQSPVEHAPVPSEPEAEPELAAESAESVTLREANLPQETELPAGELEDLPNWLDDTPPPTPAEIPDWLIEEDEEEAEPLPASLLEEDEVEEEAVADWLSDEEEVIEGGTLPDWLSDAPVESEEIPDWLLDTLDDDQPALDSEPLLSPVPDRTSAPPPKPAPAQVSPAPVPAAARDIDVAATLQSARDKLSGKDFEGSMQDYEAVVRANIQLEVVVSDLTRYLDDKEAEKHPAIYRVLGDGLMRQGSLQQALETYRKALNLL